MSQKSQKLVSKLSIKSNTKWFNQQPKIKNVANETQPPELVAALIAEAKNVLESETKLYHRLQENRRDKDFAWIKRILQSGTLSDKISAHTILIQDCPVYNISSVEALINMVNTKGKRECLMAMDALQDLFIGEVLAEDRKMKFFHQQPLKELDSVAKESPAVRKLILILWVFENEIKNLYSKFVNNLKAVGHDTVEKTKQKAVTVMCNLLKENPEQEQFLLEQVVNKIGDPVGKIGSHACYVLGQLLIQHPDMKTVVVQEVERFIFRSNLSEKAKYYSLCFLNQIILNHEEYQLANHLIMIYFSQFKLFVRKGEVDTKMMSALLTGVARAYPFAKLKDNVIMNQLDAMYRLVHMVNFNTSIQAMMLIFQVLDSKDNLSDRFYNALYRKLLDPAISGSSRQASLLNLVYRALKKDVAVVRIKAFVKRILQIALYQTPNLQCAFLVLISELCKLHPDLLDTKASILDDSDSEEHYEDVPDEDEKPVIQNEPADIKPKTESSWVHKQKKRGQLTYDLNGRDALHAGAEHASPWELVFLKNSFHPSVSLFAHQICNSTEIKYSGDPLLDFTITRFLDRFVYRNPKKPSENLKLSAQTKVFGSRKLKSSNMKKIPINASEYLQQKAEKIPPEEAFIYEYLHNKASRATKKNDSDIESICSEDFEKLLDDMHPEDDNKSLNFAKELGLHKEKKGTKRKIDSGSENESDINSLENEDLEIDSDLDDEVDFNDEEMKEAFGDIDEDLAEADFNHGSFGGMDDSIRKPSKKNKKVKQLPDEKLLASAEEFSALLEDNAGGKVDTVTSNAFINKDKSGAKQLAWEMQRDRYVKGHKWNNKKKNFRKKNFRKNIKSKR
ncbi:CCAAT/enhancer-binding protein zeta-like [Uloborus diversus]|uniref:CCAAT/enhancer-binding protein zeta-like n=1 Tax=Uloborus diversus TaxID=327109 RepID=UPI00240927E5|nr:CCAAT/enhancer-binding protein zeta-like [Uloborus diversus]